MNARVACLGWVCLALSCVPASRAQRRLLDAKLMAECEGHTCVTVDQTRDAAAAFDVEAEGYATMDDVYTACRLVMRRPSAGPTLRMRYAPTVFPKEVFPLDGGIAKAQRCTTEHDERYQEERARLIYLVSPAGYESLAPAAGNVIVPFHADQLSLAGGLSGYAVVDKDAVGLPLRDRVTVVADSADTGEVVHPGLRPGETFSWGSRDAQVVRIVLPEPPVIGWVEVAFR